MDITRFDLDSACEIARTWLPPVTPQDKVTIMNILTETEITIGIPLLRKYVELLHPYTHALGITGPDSKLREADCLASGLVFFYGSLFYIMHFPGWGAHIEDIFLYDLLYILVDHYIDDIRIHPELKEQIIAQMHILIQDPLAYLRMPLVDSTLKTIALIYYRLISRCPATKEAIYILFKAEIEGLYIQRNGNLSRNHYYDIALKKGGHTVEVLQRIVGDTDAKAAFHLGTLMQLVDDCVDVLADRQNGIHTIATHDLATKGNLDDLWIEIMQRISMIDPRFKVFAILYSIFAVYIPDRVPEMFTKELRAKTTEMNLFANCDGSSLLIEAIANELLAKDLLLNAYSHKLYGDN